MEEKKVLKNNILIIEDEHDICEVYSEEVLSMAGYKVQEAADGETGMQKIRDENWDVLLLDIMLPGKDGLRFLKIRANPELRKGLFVALTNLNSERYH